MVLDTAVLVLAVLGRVRQPVSAATSRAAPRSRTSIVAPGLVLAWLGSLQGAALLRRPGDRLRRGRVPAGRSASLRLAGAIAIAGYIADVGVSRGFLGISFAVGTVGLEVARFAARKRLHRARAGAPAGPARCWWSATPHT